MKKFTAIVHQSDADEGGSGALCLEVTCANGQGQIKAKCPIIRWLALLAFLAISPHLSTAFAQSWQLTSAGSGHWSSVASSADGTNFVAGSGLTGQSGPVVTSTNSGQTWITNNLGISANWQTVASSADGNTLLAAGGDLIGSIYYSTNAGSTWIHANASGAEWRCLACSADGQVMVAGAFGYGMQVSTNSGATWSSSPGGYWYGVACSTNGTVLAAVDGYNEVIVISTNSGTSWAQATNVPSLFWDLIACSADGTKLIAAGGSSGYAGNLIYLSTDSGTTWSLATNAPNVGWHSVASSADGTRLVATGRDASNTGWIFTSFDSGNTWISNSAPKVQWSSVASSADGTVLVGAVNNGGIWTWRATAPVITLQPTNQTVFAGTNATFNVTAISTPPLTYQWQFNGTHIPNATNTSLTIANAQTNNVGYYNIVITNIFGSVTSSNANLTVLAVPPIFINQPTNETILGGSNTTFYASAIGPQPIFYQWQFNATNIVNATNTLLSLTNLQSVNDGQYALIASNSYGITVSSNAILNVITFSPVVTSQPTNKLIFQGSNVTFTVTATGTPQLNYQWQFNGTNLVNATNTSLIIANAQYTNQGNYDVIVTNLYGSVISSNAFLTIIDLAGALNTTNLVWTTSGSSQWFPESQTTHDGVAAAQSGSVGNGQQSILQTTVSGPGTLSFWWKSFGSLSFSINGVSQGGISFSTGWQQKTYYLGAGVQTLTWTYSGGPFAFGANAAWVDQVSFISGGTAPIINSAPNTFYVRANTNVTFAVNAVGTPPLAYQWLFNTTNLINQTNATLIMLNVQPTNSGNFSVVITNSYGSISTNAALFIEQFAIDSSLMNLWMTTNGFQLQLDGILTTNPVVILGSTDLVSWLPIYTNPPTTGSIQFLDFTATNLPTRFYRAQE